MVEPKENDTAEHTDAGAPAGAEPSKPAKRVYSEVEFPYIDLEQALALTQTIHDHGGGSCQDKELAAWLNQSVEGGTYKARRSAARMFGLVEIQGGILTLTALGRDACDKTKARAALTEAFLNPELYRILYDAFGGHALPPAPAIERRIEQAGVSPKQKERARQAFQKSAVRAGFIDQANGRFVKPGGGPTSTGTREDKNPSRGGNGGGGGDRPEIDPIIRGLLARLPKSGEVWPEAERKLWLDLLAGSFKLIYKDTPSDGAG